MRRSLVAVFLCSFLLAGFDDPKTLDWQVKHLTDEKALDRDRAIDGAVQSWKAADQGKAEQRKAFRDKAIAALAAAYVHPALKDSTAQREKIMSILASADDKRAKPAFVHALKNYKPGDTETETEAATRAVMKNKDQFAGDEELGAAFVTALQAVKFSHAPSGALGAKFGDALSAIKPKGQMKPLLAIVKAPNNGQDSVANKELAGRQVIAAQALGDVGDASIVDDMIDAMFEHAHTLARRKDPTTGEDLVLASPLTTAISMILGASISKLGEPAIAPLMPFVRDQDTDRVRKVKAKFATYVSPGGYAKPTAYVDIATTTVANVGLLKVAHEIAPIVRDKKTPLAQRKVLVGLLVGLPVDELTITAIKDAYALSEGEKLQTEIAASASRLMKRELTDWLIGIGGAAKSDEDSKLAALNSAIWLAPKDRLGALRAAYAKNKLEGRKDSLWTVFEPTAIPCDRKSKMPKDTQCEEHPDLKAKNGGPLYVVWNDKTLKYGEELKLVEDVVGKCDQDAKCYLAEFKDAAKDVDQGSYSAVTLQKTRSTVKAQKAIWMLASYGKETDMIELVKLMPSLESPALRSYVQMALDKNLPNGSVDVADTIAKVVQKEREAGSATAMREAAQLEPIAIKLRARAAAKK